MFQLDKKCVREDHGEILNVKKISALESKIQGVIGFSDFSWVRFVTKSDILSNTRFFRSGLRRRLVYTAL